jgi:methionine-gamma-lyase
MKLATNNIHLGLKDIDPMFGSVMPPIYTTSTYVFPNAKEGAKRFAGKSKGMIYSRFTNPTVAVLEKRLAALEGGEMAIATASGMSAIALTLFHYLQSGDSVIAHKALYGGTCELLFHIMKRYGIKVHVVDFNNVEDVKKAIDKTTKIIYFESPTNPLLEVIDIRKITKLAKEKRILTVFDNTFAPPPLQYPLNLGIDIVVHSLTKYINGHSDLIGGAVIGSKKVVEPIFLKSFIFFGPTMSPWTAYLAMRGLETLEVRVKHQCKAALTIAQFLKDHPKISNVHYPGLESDPQNKLAKSQMSDFGSVLSFEVKGGYKAGEKMVNSVKLIHLAVSLGAVESLIEHPASMTHSELTSEERLKGGINDALIRLSVGLEDIEDIINDLKQSLNTIHI